MPKISAFILDSKKYQAELLKRFIENKVDISVFSKDQKIYSQFIRYFVFENFFGISPVFSTKNSKPYLTNSDLFFNISHTQDAIVMVVANCEIGVDLEVSNQKRNVLRIAKRYFAADEYNYLVQSEQLNKDFYTLWTLKEAQVKRSSLGIARELSEAVFYKNKNQQWFSKKYSNDFTTYFYDDLVMSVCCDNIIQKQVDFFEIEDFKFKKLELKGECHGIAP